MNVQSPAILRERLENGLEVFLVEDHSAPIATFWTWYRVGSRNELPGLTGISHWVEHMQFKGTERIAKGQIFGDVSRVGGTLNALTSQDWTAYHETLPVGQLDLSLSVEADRMTNSLFDAAEVDSERTVILSERQGSENRPAFALYEEVSGTAFHAHPYRHMVIGYEGDLRAMTRDDLFRHYQRFYHPGNAFIVSVGDFSAPELLGKDSERLRRYPLRRDASAATSASRSRRSQVSAGSKFTSRLVPHCSAWRITRPPRVLLTSCRCSLPKPSCLAAVAAWVALRACIARSSPPDWRAAPAAT